MTRSNTKEQKLAAARTYQKPGVALRKEQSPRQLKRMREALGAGTPEAFQKATQIALAIHLSKKKELDTGSKMTRTERSQMQKALHEAVQNAVYVAERIKRREDVPQQMLERAMGRPQTLIDELVRVTREQPALALAVAERVSSDAVLAVAAEARKWQADIATSSDSLYRGAASRAAREMKQEIDQQVMSEVSK